MKPMEVREGQRAYRTTRRPHAAVLAAIAKVDRFKIINDSLGHAAGDALLLEAAFRLGADLGPNDLLARVGGSVGVRVRGGWSMKPSHLLRDADVAMYESKRLGGGRVTVFDDAMYLEMVEAFRVQTDLHRALNHGEFRLVYQPIFDGSDGRLCGFKALARWDHPTRGCLSAKDFVKEANDSGLIVQIGRWVIGEACRQLSNCGKEYPNAMPLTVAVNLCDRELIDPEFASSVVEDEESRAIVGTIVAFAHALSLDVVAEGVETAAQAAVLAEMGGFRYVQGHYFSRPLGADDAEEMIDG